MLDGLLVIIENSCLFIRHNNVDTFSYSEFCINSLWVANVVSALVRHLLAKTNHWLNTILIDPREYCSNILVTNSEKKHNDLICTAGLHFKYRCRRACVCEAKEVNLCPC